jgi:hypothetical protein
VVARGQGVPAVYGADGIRMDWAGKDMPWRVALVLRRRLDAGNLACLGRDVLAGVVPGRPFAAR